MQITDEAREFTTTQQQLLQFITDECSTIMPVSRLRILLQEIRYVHELPKDLTDSSEQVHLARSRRDLLNYNMGLIQQDEALVTTMGLEAAILRKQH